MVGLLKGGDYSGNVRFPHVWSSSCRL